MPDLETILNLEKYSGKHGLTHSSYATGLFRTSCQSDVKRKVIRKRKGKQKLLREQDDNV